MIKRHSKSRKEQQERAVEPDLSCVELFAYVCSEFDLRVSIETRVLCSDANEHLLDNV